MQTPWNVNAGLIRRRDMHRGLDGGWWIGTCYACEDGKRSASELAEHPPPND